MDQAKLATYRHAIVALLDRYRELRPDDGIETYQVIDRENDHYQLMSDGWTESHRYYGCILHFDIRSGKVWVQHNGTEHKIADELMELGVAKEDIVLGFHAPELRKYTDFAVN